MAPVASCLATLPERELLMTERAESVDSAEILKETCEKTPGKKEKKNMAVHFAPDDQLVEVYPTIYKGELTHEEYYLYWFSKAEFAISKDGDQKVLKAIEHTGNIPRGLENRTTNGNTRHEINKIKGRLVVENEMLRVRDLDKKYREENADELAEYLAQIYGKVTEECKVTARELAEKDAEYVLNLDDDASDEEDEFGSWSTGIVSRESSQVNGNKKMGVLKRLLPFRSKST
jgi:hypothetical protein